MAKALRLLLIALGLIVVVFGAILGYVAATFDPNQYKQQIIDAVREKTDRTVRLDGDIQLSFFPSLGMSVSKVSLSEPRSDKVFVQADGARASLKLVPLLSRRVEVERVQIKGLSAAVVRSREGRFNFEDLTGVGSDKSTAKETAPPAAKRRAPTEPVESRGEELAVHIAGVALEGASVDFTDEVTGRRFALSHLNFKTGPIAEGVRSPIEVGFAVKADEPSLDLTVDLRTSVLAEPKNQRVNLTDLQLGLRGDARDFTNLDATLKGDFNLQLPASEVSISKLNITARGKQKEGDLDVKLDIPKLALSGEKVSGDQISLAAVFHGTNQKLDAKIRISGIEGSQKSFSTGPIEVVLDMEGKGRSVKSSLASKITGSVEAKTYEIPQFSATVQVNDPSLPKSPLDGKIEGSVRLDLARETTGVDFVTHLDESRIDGKAGVARFSSPEYTFDVKVDKLDVDRYTARSGATGGREGGKGGRGDGRPAGTEAEKPMDLSGLKGITLDGTVRIGRLKASNIRCSELRADIKVANGRLEVNPLTAGLYGGRIDGAFSALSASAPSFQVQQKLSGVDMGPLLRDAANIDRFEGKGDISIDVMTQGATERALKKGLNGKAALFVTNGSIKGIDLVGMIRNAKDKLRELKGQKTVAQNKAEKTDFTELKATFDIRDGVARNNDLTMKSVLLRVAGEGEVDVGNDRIDYLVKPTVVATSKGQGGHDLAELSGVTIPVRVHGPSSDPKYTIDYSGLAMEYGKGLLDRVKEDVKGQSGKKLGDKLKGIFGR
jgi:AsmA protein